MKNSEPQRRQPDYSRNLTDQASRDTHRGETWSISASSAWASWDTPTYTGAQSVNGAKVTAIATRNEKKRAWRLESSIQGQLRSAPGGQVDLGDVATYEDYHDLLNDPNVDLVDICLPTDQHEKVVLESIAAGKATLVEKTDRHRRRSCRGPYGGGLPSRRGVPLMVAHVLPVHAGVQVCRRGDCFRASTAN